MFNNEGVPVKLSVHYHLSEVNFDDDDIKSLNIYLVELGLINRLCSCRLMRIVA